MKRDKRPVQSIESAEYEMIKSEIRYACATIGFFPKEKPKPSTKKEGAPIPKS